MEDLHSSKPTTKVERDVSIDNKVHFVILNEQPIDNSSPVLYVAKIDPDLRSNYKNMEESKEGSEDAANCNQASWSSRKIDFSILYRENHSELGSITTRTGGTDNFHRTTYPSDEFEEEKVTYSPDPPVPDATTATSDSYLLTHQTNDMNRGNSVESGKSLEPNEDDISASIPRNPAERWTDPPSKVSKSQSIDIYNNPERPRVYSAISSLEESFQIKNQFLMARPSKPPHGRAGSSCSPYLDGDGQRAHVRSQTALADEIISFESASRTESNMNNVDMEQSTTSHVSGILKGKKHEKNTNKITFDQKESVIPIAEPKPVEMFRPSCEAYTPRMGHKVIKYKPAAERPSVDKIATSMGTIQRPNFRDALRRVAMIIHQHIIKIERRFELCRHKVNDLGLFCPEMRRLFAEDNFVTPRYNVTVLNFPTALSGLQFGKRRIKMSLRIPTVEEIYDFAHQLFNSVQLSSECSIVCLIYVERLMEIAKVPLMSDTWRPIVLCGLLLASKVWQDLSSWNIEFASVYPQFSLSAINRIESQFLKMVKWDLYISSSLYAKYYFALRSLLEKRDFRQKYVRLTAVEQLAASEAIKIQERSSAVKEGVISELSRSM